MRLPALLIVAAGMAHAHVVSMSSGDISIDGAHARYELRMPIYEMAHVTDPERAIFEHIKFKADGREGVVTERHCREDKDQALAICTALYQFPAPVEFLDVECTLHAVTVPNHVHLLHAEKTGGLRDQAIFDFSFQKATLRFRPPTPMEVAMTETGAGALRAVGGWVQVLFLASLALAARSRRELFAIGGMFLLGQVAAAAIVPRTGWLPAPRFVEAASALALAYLAVEVLLLPRAGGRWIIACALGGFHGLYFALFLQATAYRPFTVLAGAIVTEAAIIAVFALIFSRIERVAAVFRPVQVSASALLVMGMVWFFLRLKG